MKMQNKKTKKYYLFTKFMTWPKVNKWNMEHITSTHQTCWICLSTCTITHIYIYILEHNLQLLITYRCNLHTRQFSQNWVPMTNYYHRLNCMQKDSPLTHKHYIRHRDLISIANSTIIFTINIQGRQPIFKHQYITSLYYKEILYCTIFGWIFQWDEL